MIISTCGYGNTGASAALDFLRGYKEIQIIDSIEFQLLHAPDAILDLKYHLTQSKERIASGVALARFERITRQTVGKDVARLIGPSFYDITDKYIEKLTVARWNGESVYDPVELTNEPKSKLLKKIQNKITFTALEKNHPEIHYPKIYPREFSLMSEKKFDEITKEYLRGIISLLDIDMNKDIVFDMLFSATNPKMGTEFFDDVKMIIVDRDPRDLYVCSAKWPYSNFFMPLEYKSFCEYYLAMKENTEPYEGALVIEYEDLIYHYYETTEAIIDYLGFDHRPEDEFKYFNPDVSVKYTKAYLKYSELIPDMSYFTEKLGKYYYDYTEYKPVKEQKILNGLK